MLTAATLHHLAAFTCPGCQQSLGRFHAYPITDPSALLLYLTEQPPMHLSCAETAIEGQQTTAAIYIVKAAPKAASAALVRLHPEDPETVYMRMFSPDSIHFPLTLTYDQIRDWILPAVAAAKQQATSNEELQELVGQIARLHAFLPHKPTA